MAKRSLHLTTDDLYCVPNTGNTGSLPLKNNDPSVFSCMEQIPFWNVPYFYFLSLLAYSHEMHYRVIINKKLKETEVEITTEKVLPNNDFEKSWNYNEVYEEVYTYEVNKNMFYIGMLDILEKEKFVKKYGFEQWLETTKNIDLKNVANTAWRSLIMFEIASFTGNDYIMFGKK